jgi:predicted ATPase
VISVILGYPDTARKRSEDRLAAARRSSDPASIAHALQADNSINRLLGDAPKVLERAEEELEIGTEYGMASHLMLGAFVHGWALAVQGRAQEGISEMRRFTRVGRLDGFGMLAEGYLAGGRPDEGLDAVSEGFAQVEKSGQRLFEARLHQLKGELLLMQSASNVDEAESCFRTAIEVARRQGAKLFELRATNSLARLLTKQGHRAEARAMLGEIYDWFTEGFDTADLKDAKALLDELSNV